MAGPREGPIILVFVIATLAASGLVLHRAEADAVKDPKQKASRGEITGLSELSLARAENLRKALAKVDQGKYPLIANIRVAPDRINLMVLNKDGYRKYLTIDPGFGVSSSDAGVGEDYAVHSESINAEAPQRMLGAVVAKTGLKASAFDYAATSFSKDSKTTWFMAMKDGPARVRQWVAEADGSDVRHPGELATADRKKQEETARKNAEYQAQVKRRVRHIQAVIKRRTRCMNRATNAAQVSRCIEKYQP